MGSREGKGLKGGEGSGKWAWFPVLRCAHKVQEQHMLWHKFIKSSGSTTRCLPAPFLSPCHTPLSLVVVVYFHVAQNQIMVRLLTCLLRAASLSSKNKFFNLILMKIYDYFFHTAHGETFVLFIIVWGNPTKERGNMRERKEKRLFVSKVWCKLASRLNLFNKRVLFAKIAKDKREETRNRISYNLNLFQV